MRRQNNSLPHTTAPEKKEITVACQATASGAGNHPSIGRLTEVSSSKIPNPNQFSSVDITDPKI